MPSESKTEAQAAVPAGSLKAVFEVPVVKDILNSGENPQVQLVLLPAEIVAGRQIAAAIAPKSKHVRVKSRVAKDGRKIA